MLPLELEFNLWKLSDALPDISESLRYFGVQSVREILDFFILDSSVVGLIARISAAPFLLRILLVHNSVSQTYQTTK